MRPLSVNTHKQLKDAAIYAILFSALAYFAILFLDKPFAYFFAKYTMHWHWLHPISENMCPIVATITALVILYHYRKALIQGILTAIYFYLTVEASMIIKSEFKYVFSRYWPNTWKDNNLSLLKDGAYGFQWFQAYGEGTSSFPSGHSTWVAFCVVWLCFFCPRYKYLWIALMPIIAIALILQNFHYLGDCFAGFGLGIALGLISIIVWGTLLKLVNRVKEDDKTV